MSRTTVEALSRKRTRRLIVGGLAAALITGGGVAAAVGQLNQPDPEHARAVVEAASVDAEVHTPGWRPELDAEVVECIGADPDPDATAATWASEFPLADALTADLLITECTSGTDAGARSVAEATLCARSNGDSPRPVVAMDGQSCEDVGARPVSDADLEDLNRMRAREVEILASFDGCLTREDAIDRVESRIGGVGEPALGVQAWSAEAAASEVDGLREVAADQAELDYLDADCWVPMVEWSSGRVVVSPESLRGLDPPQEG